MLSNSELHVRRLGKSFENFELFYFKNGFHMQEKPQIK